MLPTLLQALQNPAAYPHDVNLVDVRETHISWVLLTGEFAYKIKKPVDLGFVDFTTLARRQHFCREEIRLNRRWAPSLYLGVVPIAGSHEQPRVGGQGEAFEFAVQMRQFPEADLLGRMLAEGRLTSRHIDQLAARVGEQHLRLASCPIADDWGSAEAVWNPVEENFVELRYVFTDSGAAAQLSRLEQWSRSEFHRLQPDFAQRKLEGFVRECHGDLHLGNIVVWEGQITPFDCIEFNPGLRWIDVMNEIAFVVMDLEDHHHAAMGRRLLNQYLEFTGDYRGVTVLPFYLVYRAIVRAKVDALRLHQRTTDGRERNHLIDELGSYLSLAEDYTKAARAELSITHGCSGSGKTTGTNAFIEQEQAIRIRSDVERKRLCGLSASERVDAGVGTGIYSAEITERTYHHLADLARAVLRAGINVIVDATFLRRWQRDLFRHVASAEGVRFRILPFWKPESVLRERIAQRTPLDASDATAEVLERQLAALEPLSPEEMAFVTSRAAPDNGPAATPDS